MKKVVVFAVFAALGAHAQNNGSTTGSSGAIPSGATVAPTRTPTAPTPPMQGTASPAITAPRPIFLSGKVMMDDGLPVPPNVTIQRVCAGIPHSVAYTDSKGRFSFQWGQSNGVMIDASESSAGLRGTTNSIPLSGLSAGGAAGMGSDPFSTNLSNCDLQASLAGYRSDQVRLYDHTSTGNPEVGIIILHRLAGVEGTSISATSLMAPKDAKKAYDKALMALARSKPEEAAKELEKAVAAYPKYADAWSSLGKIRAQEKSNEAARDAFLKAIDADPKLVFPYLQLGMMSAGENNWEAASQYLERATKLDPVDYPNAWYVCAVANFNLRKFDAAEKSAREAVKLDPRHINPRANYLLGLVLVEKRDYAGAEASLNSYLTLLPNADEAVTIKAQLGQIRTYLESAPAAND